MPGHVVAPLGCWVAFLVRRIAAGVPLADPSAARLAAIAANGDGRRAARRLADAALGLLPGLAADTAAVEAIGAAADLVLAGEWSALFSAACH